MESLLGNKKEDVVPYLGRLYSLNYPQVENVSPEFWKSRLQTAVLAIFTALAAKAPTVFFMEDLHWADPSFMELIRRAFLEIRQPAIVLCTYRPTLSLFTGQQQANVAKYYHEIRLENLTLSDAQSMLESLLKTENIPSDLKRWVQNKAEGNPFYLEELINSLIESDRLVQDGTGWKLTGSLTESDIPSSLHGTYFRQARSAGETDQAHPAGSVRYRPGFSLRDFKKDIRASRTHRRRTEPTGEA